MEGEEHEEDHPRGRPAGRRRPRVRTRTALGYPYVTQNGTYVQGHMQTNPDGNPYNNWSTQGNVNPYTGQMGTVNPYPQQRQYVPQVPQFPQVQSPTVCHVNTSGQYVCR